MYESTGNSLKHLLTLPDLTSDPRASVSVAAENLAPTERECFATQKAKWGKLYSCISDTNISAWNSSNQNSLCTNTRTAKKLNSYEINTFHTRNHI